MIKARSPYYVTVPFVNPQTLNTCTKYILKIRMWRGAEGDAPTISNYEMTRYNYSNSTGSEEVDISAIIYSFLESVYTSADDGVTAQNTINQGRARIDIAYFINDNPDDFTRILESHSICLGYGFGNEGKNTTIPSSDVLINGSVHRCSSDGIFIVPVYSFISAKTVTITSTPNNLYSRSYTVPSSSNSRWFYNLVGIDTKLVGTDNRVNIDINGTKLVLLIDQSKKHKNTDVHFINQYGVQQSVSMNKQRNESLNITSKQYERYAGQPSDGYHQFKTFLSNGKSSVILNSGYLSEGQNSSFKELLLSESIWLSHEGEVLPVSIKTSNLLYKTVANDSVINYEIKFDYAYNEINSI